MKRLLASFLVIVLVIIADTELFSQEIPCRQWFIKRDRNGNELKTNCKEAWQVNSDGQKHGKYIEYFEDGNPSISASYLNGVLNGPYKSFSGDGVTLESGSYKNGLKDGVWKEEDRGWGFATGNYLKGERNGTWTWAENEIKGVYLNGKYNGEWSRKLFSVKLTGSLSEDGSYTGKAAILKNRGFPDERTMVVPYPETHCDCYRPSADNMEIVRRILEYYKNSDAVYIVSDFEMGRVINYEAVEIYVDGNLQSSSKLIVSNVIKEIETEKLAKANAEKDYNEKASKGVSANKDIIAGFKPASITFKLDSYEADMKGLKELSSFQDVFNRLDIDGIKYFLIIGHAAADDELGKKVFDPNNDGYLRSRKGNQTNMSEKHLAALRVLLSLGRAKTVYKILESLSGNLLMQLIEQRKFYMLPAGTLYGNQLSTKTPNIVQLVIITEGEKEINSEIEPIPFGIDFKNSSVLKSVNEQIRLLPFPQNIFSYLRVDTWGNNLRDYGDLAVNGVAGFLYSPAKTVAITEYDSPTLNQIEIIKKIKSNPDSFDADIDAFKETSRSNTIESYEKYLSSFPNGLFAAEASGKVLEMRNSENQEILNRIDFIYEQLEKNLKLNTKEGYEYVVSMTEKLISPKGPVIDEPRLLVATIYLAYANWGLGNVNKARTIHMENRGKTLNFSNAQISFEEYFEVLFKELNGKDNLPGGKNNFKTIVK